MVDITTQYVLITTINFHDITEHQSHALPPVLTTLSLVTKTALPYAGGGGATNSDRAQSRYLCLKYILLLVHRNVPGLKNSNFLCSIVHVSNISRYTN